MSRRNHFFPVSHNINGDPDLWDLTDRFGDRALRVWLEILAILDHNGNHFEATEQAWKAVFRKCRIKLGNGQQIAAYLLANGFLAVHQRFPSGLQTSTGAPNYWKYHKGHVPEAFHSSPQPNLTEPNSFSYKNKRKTEPAAPDAPKAPRFQLQENPESDQPKTKTLDPAIKAVADVIYQSDPVKFRRLVVWIKQAEKAKFEIPAITLALERMLPYTKTVGAE